MAEAVNGEKNVDATARESLPATTTLQQDLIVESQRRINLIWERTQAFISVIVVLSNMIVAGYNAVVHGTGEVPMVMSSTLFLVVGFYFSRTNHAAIGGIGFKPAQEYLGR